MLGLNFSSGSFFIDKLLNSLHAGKDSADKNRVAKDPIEVLEQSKKRYQRRTEDP